MRACDTLNGPDNCLFRPMCLLFTSVRAEVANAAPITFKHRQPVGVLSQFVELFWYWSGHPRPFVQERILPFGTVELVIRLESPRTSESGIAGPRSMPTIIKRHRTNQLLGVHFKPGGAFPFLGFPFGELHNTWITLADLWGEKRARRLLCLLYEAPTIEHKFELLERWLTWSASHPLKHHAAVAYALGEFDNDPGLHSSAVVAEEVNLSQRRFIDLFRNEVGMTPKLFCRVQRFRDIVETIQPMENVDWVDLALSFGYTDQSHFIHEFREFSGLRPSQYLDLRTEHVGHVKIPE
jgi:AraC-like DNA-binding protein